MQRERTDNHSRRGVRFKTSDGQRPVFWTVSVTSGSAPTVYSEADEAQRSQRCAEALGQCVSMQSTRFKNAGLHSTKCNIKSLTQDFFPPVGVRLLRVHPFVVLTRNSVSHVWSKFVDLSRVKRDEKKDSSCCYDSLLLWTWSRPILFLLLLRELIPVVFFFTNPTPDVVVFFVDLLLSWRFFFFFFFAVGRQQLDALRHPLDWRWEQRVLTWLELAYSPK